MIIYQGPSELDGKPIVAIITGTKFGTRSRNPKTADIPQVWIIRADMTPSQAVRELEDYSICGDCKYRGRNGKKRTCYVRPYTAPRAVYGKFVRGGYADFWANAYAIDTIRIGAYGDPAAVPVQVWQRLAAVTGARIIGYTHQWKQPRFEELKAYCMASVDTPAERAAADKFGWRTFRTTDDAATRAKSESVCPATTVGLTCAQCKACDGQARQLRGSIVIAVHGAGAAHYQAAIS